MRTGLRLLLALLVAAGALASAAAAARIAGGPGADFLRGRSGADRVVARGGNDRVAVAGGGRDTVLCGTGRDVVNADPSDRLAVDCEVVSRRISTDPFRNPESQHATQVEPDTFAFGSTVVAVFQTGRIFSGAAANIGFATSRDAGRTWRQGQLPSLTPNSRPAGEWPLVSDPSVAYDALHRVWLVASLAIGRNTSAILVSRSSDGISWSAPVAATLAPTLGPLLLDKEWIVCDNGTSSPFRGRCYVSYSDFRTVGISTQASTDGGLTWTEPAGAPDDAGRRSMVGNFAPGVQPVVRPDGTLVIPFYDEDRMAAIRSTDGGLTFSPSVEVAPASYRGVRGLRASPLPTAEVDAAGTVYVVWSDCRTRPGCRNDDLVLSRSADGVTWSAPARIPLGAASSSVDFVDPGLGVDPASSGATARLALAYYSLDASGRLGVGWVTSVNGGASWSRPQRLDAEPMSLAWLPRTTGGRMVGDYISTSFVGGRAVPVFSLASPPRGGLFDEATFAARLPVAGAPLKPVPPSGGRDSRSQAPR